MSPQGSSALATLRPGRFPELGPRWRTWTPSRCWTRTSCLPPPGLIRTSCPRPLSLPVTVTAAGQPDEELLDLLSPQLELPASKRQRCATPESMLYDTEQGDWRARY